MNDQLSLLSPTIDDQTARRLGLQRTREVKRPHLGQPAAPIARPGSQPAKTFSTVDVPRAANADPETSHLAAERIKASGALGKQQQLVRDAVRHWPGYTSAELAQELAIADGVELSARRAMVARRLPEVALLHVKRGSPRDCRVTGSKCVTWWPL